MTPSEVCLCAPLVREMSGSDHYNHSTFADLVITGLAGIVPRPDDILEKSPLFPEEWDYFCLEGVGYRGHLVTIVWDRTGARYGEKRYASERAAWVRLDIARVFDPDGGGKLYEE